MYQADTAVRENTAEISTQNNGYLSYLHHIEELASGLELPNNHLQPEFENEQPSQIIRKCFTVRELREMGAFFTGQKLARKISTLVQGTSATVKGFFDPAIGAGDLLLSVADQLPREETLKGTIDVWGNLLAGYDINELFVRTAKARLVLKARQLMDEESKGVRIDLENTFPSLCTDDFLTTNKPENQNRTILINPPFSIVSNPIGSKWSSGKVNSAALFIDRAIHSANTGTRLIAILPDVLRSGSRYGNWRKSITAKCKINSIYLHGLFDRSTDVNVFIADMLIAEKSNPSSDIWTSRKPKKETRTFLDLFDIRIGPVVPHRNSGIGRLYPYLHAKNSPAWGEKSSFNEFVIFDGSVFKPPFITIKRTSRPDEKGRATATLVLGPKSIAVENHLIVLIPRNGSIDLCKDAISRLRSNKTDIYLDEIIRCRHLTKSAVSRIPWWRTL